MSSPLLSTILCFALYGFLDVQGTDGLHSLNPDRHSIFRLSGLAWGVAIVGFALAVVGCSCGGGSMIVPMTITVSLPVTTVVVPQDGTQVIVPINITSTSETALVAVNGLPSGLQEKYAASDTTPPDRSCLPSVLRLRQAPLCQP